MRSFDVYFAVRLNKRLKKHNIRATSDFRRHDVYMT